MADTIYDLAIIGGGPAGYTAAIRAGEFGLKTALIDASEKLGGTCLHVGCIPTKALLFSAEVWDHLKHASELGIDNVTAPQANWPNLLKRKNAIIAKHVKGLEFLMRKNKVDVIQAYARLTGPAQDGIHTVSLYTAGGGGAAGRRGLTGDPVQVRGGPVARMMACADSEQTPGADDLALAGSYRRSQ